MAMRTLAAVLAILPAIPIRLLLHGIPGEVVSALVFLLIFGSEWWWYHYRREPALAR